MNRRTAIRKAAGFGVVAAGLPVLSKVVEAKTSLFVGQNCGDLTCGPTPTYTPPPPDTRTPEQLLVDQDTEEIADVIRHLTHKMYPGQRRYAYSVYDRVFDAVQSEVRTRALPVITQIVAGVGTILVGPNGNVIRHIGQKLYFA